MNILDSLKTIFQEVNAARSLPEVLTIIVTEVQAAMNARVCVRIRLARCVYKWARV
jgi:signal transduction protein with GAF and PtsI domain